MCKKWSCLCTIQGTSKCARKKKTNQRIVWAFVSWNTHPLLVFLQWCPIQCILQKNQKIKKSVQVLKHQVSNVLIFQWRMTSAQSSSKEREWSTLRLLQKRNSTTQAKLQGICVLQCLIMIIFNLYLQNKPFSVCWFLVVKEFPFLTTLVQRHMP